MTAAAVRLIIGLFALMRGFGLFLALRLLPAAAGRLLAALRLLRFLRLFGLCLLGFRLDGTAAAIAASLFLFLGGCGFRRGCDHHRYRPLVNRLLLFLLRLRHIVQHLRKRISLLRPSARDSGKLVGLEQMQGIVRIVIQLDLDGLAQEIDLNGGAVAVLRFDESALLRNLLQQILVCHIHRCDRHVCPWYHDIPGDGISEVHNVGYHFFFLALDDTLFLADVYHAYEFVFGHLLVPTVLVKPYYPENKICNFVYNKYHRRENNHEELDYVDIQ